MAVGVDTLAVRQAMACAGASRLSCNYTSFTIVNNCLSISSEEKHQGVITVAFDIV
jgi:hypothetical protein